MLTLRLQRAGKKNKPEFRIVLADKTAAASKKFMEILGNYNPRTKDFAIKDESRLKYWVEQHVDISPTLNNLLVSKNLISTPKQKAFLIPTKVKAKKAEAAAKAEAELKAKAEAEAAKAEAADNTESAEATETVVAEEAPTETAEQVETEPAVNQPVGESKTEDQKTE